MTISTRTVWFLPFCWGCGARSRRGAPAAAAAAAAPIAAALLPARCCSPLECCCLARWWAGWASGPSEEAKPCSALRFLVRSMLGCCPI